MSKEENRVSVFEEWIHSATCHTKTMSTLHRQKLRAIMAIPVAKLGHFMYPGKSIATHL